MVGASHLGQLGQLGAVDKSPGGVWINFIRHTLEDSQSIVAVSVTGSLVSLTLFSCRDANCTDRSSIFCIVCGTDWVLPAGYQLPEYVECGTMDADGFSIVDNRAGVTFGTICAMGCAGDGGGSFVNWYCASAKRSGCFRNDWSSLQRDRDSHSAREGTPVAFECLFRTTEVWTRTFMT